MPTSKIVYSDKQCGVACHGNVVVMEMRGALTGAHVRTIGDTYRTLALEHAKLVTLVLARHGAPIVSAEVREEGSRVARETASLVAQVAIVFEDTGVLVQLMRTALRGFSIMARNTPLRVYDDLKSSIVGIRPFVLEELRADFEPQLLRLIQQLRLDTPA